MDCAIRNARVLTPQGLQEGWQVVIADGQITAVGRPGDEPSSDLGEVVDATGLYLVPGFVDVHAHGAELFEFTAGYFDAATGAFDASDDAWRRGLPVYARFMARTGVTSAIVATWAAPVEHLARVFDRLAEYVSGPNNGRDGARLLGGNLEGTFINPNMAGAQNPALTLDPNRASFDAINRAGIVRMVNICPDRGGEKALDLIEHVRKKGIIPGFGHSAATGDQVREAVRRGLRYCVHFLNGPLGSSHKPFYGAGAVEAVLRSREIFAELIVDKYHVLPEYVRDTLHRKGTDRVMAVTDQMFATGAKGVSEFTLSGVRGKVSADGRYVQVADKPDSLYSSVLQMHVGFANVLSLLTSQMEGIWTPRHEALGLEEALVVAARIFSTNAAEMLMLNDEIGSIAPGKRADLVLLRIEGRPGEYCVKVLQTFVGGLRVA